MQAAKQTNGMRTCVRDLSALLSSLSTNDDSPRQTKEKTKETEQQILSEIQKRLQAARAIYGRIGDELKAHTAEIERVSKVRASQVCPTEALLTALPDWNALNAETQSWRLDEEHAHIVQLATRLSRATRKAAIEADWGDLDDIAKSVCTHGDVPLFCRKVAAFERRISVEYDCEHFVSLLYEPISNLNLEPRQSVGLLLLLRAAALRTCILKILQKTLEAEWRRLGGRDADVTAPAAAGGFRLGWSVAEARLLSILPIMAIGSSHGIGSGISVGSNADGVAEHAYAATNVARLHVWLATKSLDTHSREIAIKTATTQIEWSTIEQRLLRFNRQMIIMGNLCLEESRSYFRSDGERGGFGQEQFEAPKRAVEKFWTNQAQARRAFACDVIIRFHCCRVLSSPSNDVTEFHKANESYRANDRPLGSATGGDLQDVVIGADDVAAAEPASDAARAALNRTDRRRVGALRDQLTGTKSKHVLMRSVLSLTARTLKALIAQEVALQEEGGQTATHSPTSSAVMYNKVAALWSRTLQERLADDRSFWNRKMAQPFLSCLIENESGRIASDFLTKADPFLSKTDPEAEAALPTRLTAALAAVSGDQLLEDSVALGCFEVLASAFRSCEHLRRVVSDGRLFCAPDAQPKFFRTILQDALVRPEIARIKKAWNESHDILNSPVKAVRVLHSLLLLANELATHVSHTQIQTQNQTQAAAPTDDMASEEGSKEMSKEGLPEERVSVVRDRVLEELVVEVSALEVRVVKLIAESMMAGLLPDRLRFEQSHVSSLLIKNGAHDYARMLSTEAAQKVLKSVSQSFLKKIMSRLPSLRQNKVVFHNNCTAALSFFESLGDIAQEDVPAVSELRQVLGEATEFGGREISRSQ